jgi:DNA-binding NarL/FixJ family response regulator
VIEAPIGVIESSLTPKQREIFSLMIDGHKRPAICKMLNMSIHTLKHHVRHASHRLGVLNHWDIPGRIVYLIARERGLLGNGWPD